MSERISMQYKMPFEDVDQRYIRNGYMDLSLLRLPDPYDGVYSAMTRAETEAIRQGPLSESQRIWVERAAYETIMQGFDGGVLYSHIAKMPYSADLMHSRYLAYDLDMYVSSDHEIETKEDVDADLKRMEVQKALESVGSEHDGYTIVGNRQLCLTTPFDSAFINATITRGFSPGDSNLVKAAPDGYIFETYVVMDTDDDWGENEPIRRFRLVGLTEYTAGDLNVAKKSRGIADTLIPFFDYVGDEELLRRQDSVMQYVLNNYFGVSDGYRVVPALPPLVNLVFLKMRKADLSRVGEMRDSRIKTTLASINFPPPKNFKSI